MTRRSGVSLLSMGRWGTGMVGLILLGNSLVFGQGFSAAMSGSVRDASGAVIPQATVTARNIETGQTRVAETGANGNFNLPALPVGPYEITVEKAGFRQLVRSGITLSVAQEAVLNLTLEVGQVQQTVEVTGEAPIVNTTLAATSGLINEGQIQDLPLNGRSFDQLLTLNTGTVNNTSNTGGNWTGFSVAGKRPESNRFVMNGVDYVGDNATGVFVTPAGSSGQLLGVDAVREYNVLGHTYGAEYGKRAGGQITAVTISGTNQLHGAVFEYLRNSAFDARNYFALADSDGDGQADVPPFKRNQFGVSLGGPVVRDKLFLFGNYEGFRERLALSTDVVTPDAQVRQGLLPCNLITPAPSPCPESGYAPAPNLKAGMLPFFRYFPEPNGPQVLAGGLPTGTAHRFSNPLQNVREDFGLLRFDYVMSNQDSWSANYTIDDGDRAGLGNEGNPIFVNNTTIIAQTLSVQETHIFSPTILNVATFGLSRGGGTAETVPLETFPENLSFLTGGKAGNPGSVNIGGGGLTTAVASIVQANGANPHFNNRRIYSGADDLRVVRGKHTLSFGVKFEKIHQNAFSGGQGNAGTFSFPTLLAFLQDRPTQFLVNPNPTPFFFRSTEAAWYIQDEMKLLPNLTVRLGLRDEMTTGWNERDGHASNYDLDQNGVVQTLPYIGKSALLENNAIALWQPRVGVAWDPTGSGRWAVRAGFGIHNDLQDNLGIRLGSNFPFNARLTIPGPATAGGRGLLDIIPLPAGTEPSPPCTTVGQTNPPCAIFAPGGIDPRMHTPTISQWSLTVERGITEDLMLQVSYVGSESYHLSAAMNRNFAGTQVCEDPAGCLSGGSRPRAQAVTVPQGTTFVPWTGRRANPLVGSTLDWYYVGTSSYHSGNISLVKRSRGGLMFKTNYTFSKTLDLHSATSTITAQNQASTVLNPFDLDLSHGPAAFHLQHQFNTNFSYPLPFGQGKALGGGATGWVDKLISGWQWNGILSAQSGFPITLLVGSNASGTGDTQNPDYPNRNPSFQGPVILGTDGFKKTGRYFDPDAFSRPLAGTFGNAGRGSFIGPRLINVDTSLFKNIPINERWSLQFRAEAFNLLNHVNFDTPNTAVFSGATGNAISPSAGRIRETANRERQIQFALRLEF